MFRQHLVQAISFSKIFAKSRSKPKFLLRHLKSCFVRPQRVILLLIIGCPAARNDHKIASVEQKNLSLVPFDKYTFQNILFRRLFLAPALKKLYLFGGRRGGGILSKKTNFGGDGAVIMHSQLSHTSQSRKVFFSFLCVRNDYEVEDRQQKDTLTRKLDRDQAAIILANLSNYSSGIRLTQQGIVIELDLKQ